MVGELSERAELARAWVDAWNEDGVEGAAAFWAPSIEWHDPPEAPDAGVYRGHDAVLERSYEVVATIGRFNLTLEEVVDAGDEVVAVCMADVRGASSGISGQMPFVYVIRIDGELIDRVQLFLDRDRAMAAAGLT